MAIWLSIKFAIVFICIWHIVTTHIFNCTASEHTDDKWFNPNDRGTFRYYWGCIRWNGSGMLHIESSVVLLTDPARIDFWRRVWMGCCRRRSVSSWHLFPGQMGGMMLIMDVSGRISRTFEMWSEMFVCWGIIANGCQHWIVGSIVIAINFMSKTILKTIEFSELVNLFHSIAICEFALALPRADIRSPAI